MDRSELNEKAKKYLDNAGFGTGTNITLHGAKCLMVDFYIDMQVKNSETELICPDCNCNKAFWNPSEEENQCPCGHTWVD